MRLFSTSSSNYINLILRVTVGVVMLAHGLQKIGAIGDGTPAGTVGFLGTLGVPVVIAWLVIIAETVGAFSLIIGFLGRFCALSLIIDMIGAILLVHLQNGFFMPNGYEYHLLAIATLIPVVIKGSGMLSVDSLMARN